MLLQDDGTAGALSDVSADACRDMRLDAVIRVLRNLPRSGGGVGGEDEPILLSSVCETFREARPTRKRTTTAQSSIVAQQPINEPGTL